jgi:hypothetical protein
MEVSNPRLGYRYPSYASVSGADQPKVGWNSGWYVGGRWMTAREEGLRAYDGETHVILHAVGDSDRRVCGAYLKQAEVARDVHHAVSRINAETVHVADSRILVIRLRGLPLTARAGCRQQG